MSLGGIYAMNQCLVNGAVSSIAMIPQFRDQGMEMGVAPLIITPSDPVSKFFASCP